MSCTIYDGTTSRQTFFRRQYHGANADLRRFSGCCRRRKRPVSAFRWVRMWYVFRQPLVWNTATVSLNQSLVAWRMTCTKESVFVRRFTGCCLIFVCQSMWVIRRIFADCARLDLRLVFRVFGVWSWTRGRLVFFAAHQNTSIFMKWQELLIEYKTPCRRQADKKDKERNPDTSLSWCGKHLSTTWEITPAWYSFHVSTATVCKPHAHRYRPATVRFNGRRVWTLKYDEMHKIGSKFLSF